MREMFVEKRLLLVLILGLFLLGIGYLINDSLIRAGDDTSIIGFVSVQAIFQIHPEREKAEEALQQKALEMQLKLEEEAKDLEVEDQQMLLQRYQQELGLYEQELIAVVIEEIEDTIAQVARDERVEVVLEASHVIYGGVDLTPKVIAYLERE